MIQSYSHGGSLTTTAESSLHQATVIVSLNEEGKVHDIVGDVLYYANSQDELTELLVNLLVGWMGETNLIADVQMPTGRYSDIRIVRDGDLCHAVLFDVTLMANERQRTMQLSHEMVLSERCQRVDLESQLGKNTNRLDRSPERRAKTLQEPLDFLVRQMQFRIARISMLAQQFSEPPDDSKTELHAIGEIQRSAMHLQASVLACTEHMGLCSPRAIKTGGMNIEFFVEEMTRKFGASNQLPEVRFETTSCTYGQGAVQIDNGAIRDSLICLTTSILDAFGEPVVVQLGSSESCLLVNFNIDSYSADTTLPDAGVLALQSDLRFLASKAWVNDMGGRIHFSSHAPMAIRVEFTNHRDIAERNASEIGPALVAIDDDALYARISRLLMAFGIVDRRFSSLEAMRLTAESTQDCIIIVCGDAAGPHAMALSYQLHSKGADRRMLLLRSGAFHDVSSWVWDGRRAIVSADADDDALSAAIDGIIST